MADENTTPAAPAVEPAPAPAAPATAPATPDMPLTERDRQKNINDVCLRLEGGAGEAGAPKVVKAKGSKNVQAGLVHVTATFNNTLVTVTDRGGNVIGWSSAGKMGSRVRAKAPLMPDRLCPR